MYNENIKEFINAVIQGDKDSARSALAPVIVGNAREILGYQATEPQPVNEAIALKMLREMFEDHEEPIRIQGDKVFVDGKQQGFIQTDYADEDSGINFIEEGGKFSKEFDDVSDLFKFLIQRYSKQGGGLQ